MNRGGLGQLRRLVHSSQQVLVLAQRNCVVSMFHRKRQNFDRIRWRQKRRCAGRTIAAAFLYALIVVQERIKTCHTENRDAITCDAFSAISSAVRAPIVGGSLTAAKRR
jgi:hypothetical protein